MFQLYGCCMSLKSTCLNWCLT
uniref:Uncharacterized protein n=1 Tax=Rhizophora mucronata TaxID=61149 RepID=A0A2P2PXH0_RHIMU